MNKAFFVGGPLDGTFNDVAPNTKEIKSQSEKSGLEIPGQLSLFPELPGETVYTVATFMLAPNVGRRMFADSTLTVDEVEEKMGFFMADLWDQCAEDNE